MFSIAAHFHFTKSYQFVELLTFPKLRHTQNTQHFLKKFHQNVFWLTNIYIQELCNLLIKLYALQSRNKSVQKFRSVMHSGQWDCPPPLAVPSFDNDIRLLLWFVTNTSHNCPGLSYTNKQIKH